MKKHSYKHYCIILSILYLFSLLPLICISFFNRPSADDFNYSWRTFQTLQNGGDFFALLKSAWDTTIYYWHNWQGLYTSAFLLSLQPGIFGNSCYALTGILMLLLIVGSTLYATMYLSVKLFHSSRMEGFFLGTSMSFLMVQFMPSCVEGLFWFNGTMNYGFYFALLLFLFIGLLRIKQTDVPHLYLLILPISWGFLLEGGNHVTAFMALLLVLSFLTLTIYQKEKTKSMFYIFILLFMAAAFLLNILSPGTKVRQSSFQHLNPLSAIYLAVRYGTTAISDWFSLPILFVLLLSLPVLFRMAVNLVHEKGFRFYHPLFVIIASIGWLCAMFCPPLYAMGTPGAGRLYDIVYYCFIFLLFVDCFYLCGYIAVFFSEHTNSKPLNIQYTKITALLLLVGLLVASLDGHGVTATIELINGSARSYAAEADRRESSCLSRTEDTVTFHGFQSKPSLLFFDDISTDPKEWNNTAYARYYGLESAYILPNEE